VARSLVTRKTFHIGFVLPDILNPVHAAIAKAFEDTLRADGYSLVIGNSDESPDREMAYLNDFLGKEVDGIALTPTCENQRMLFSIVESGKHLVLLDRRLDGLEVDCVLFDNTVGAHEAVRHLIELGHRRIGLVNLARSKTPGQERFEGYERALVEAGIEADPRWVVEGSFKAQEGFELAELLLQVSPRPTALLVSSNRLTSGVLRAVKRHNLNVPGDLALVAFDDVEYYAHSTPSITAVGTSVASFGSEAARLLVERISGAYAAEPRIIRVPCELRIRESTAGISKGAV
jgi:DNA-binding LacI/PurR family transcriptional regulator